MWSQHHKNCKVPAKDIKKRIPLAEQRLSKNTAPQTSKIVVPVSKIPVPIKRRIPCNGDGSLNFKGLSISDSKLDDASVNANTEPPRSHSSVGSNDVASASNVNQKPDTENQPLTDQALPTDESCLKLVKVESDLPVVQLYLDDKNLFDRYKMKFAKFGGADMQETVREIGQKMICDTVLMKYSYLGRREKLRFKDYDNVTRLVIASTIESIKMKHLNIHGKEMVQTDDEAEKLYNDAEKYFTKEYIKKAETRYKRSLH